MIVVLVTLLASMQLLWGELIQDWAPGLHKSVFLNQKTVLPVWFIV